MSLLMKALEQAAKDRGEARNERAASAAPAAGETMHELSPALELLAADAPAPPAQANASPKSRSPGDGAGASARVERDQAATSVRAGEHARAKLDHQRRVNPLIVFGASAALLAAAFATYVYLQIYHPGVFARNRPPQQPAAPSVQLPQPTGPTAAPPAAPDLALAAGAVLQPPAADVRPAPAATMPAPAATIPAPVPKPDTPSPLDMAAGPPASMIVVSGGTAGVTVNPMLLEAYNALQAGNLDAAQRAYAQITRDEPRNIDALLGLAAVATLQGRTDDATRHYQRILELDPRHALAQSGLIGLFGHGDPLAAETRLKQLIARDPSAFLYFTLGNLYADQSLWPQAQQAYFQAHHLEPGNPDYAYNLAVGLEHVSQPRLAVEFYRRAATLAAGRGHANFDVAQVRDRMSRLAAQVD